MLQKMPPFKFISSIEGSTALVLAAGMLMLASAAVGTWLSGHQTPYTFQLLDIFCV